MNSSIKDKVVLVSGAAGRIGAATSHAVVDGGGLAILVDWNADKLEELIKCKKTSRSFGIVADLTDVGSIEQAIEKAVERFGKVDVAVHAAYPKSLGWGASFEDLAPNNLSEDLYGQLGGAILFSQKILGQFCKQGHGNLIHVSSIQGVAAPKFHHYQGTSMASPIEYTAIKAGVIAITRYLAKYYKDQNIRVNCISPGGILDGQPDLFLEKYRQDCNSKGMLEPSDLMGALMFLISDHSKYLSGQNIIIDDGWSL